MDNIKIVTDSTVGHSIDYNIKREDIHEDIREHNIQTLQQNSLQLKFEITIRLNNIVQHPYPLNPINITAQSLPPPFITTEVIYKYDRYTKNTISYITFHNPYSGLPYTCIFQHILFLMFSDQNINPSPRTRPQDSLVTHDDCEENEQKTLHKYAINQVSQCETEPQAIETTNVIATLYSKARATTVTGYKFTATFSEKKVHCSQVSNGNKNRLDHESFYQSNIERLLHLSPDDCKNELLKLNITRNKNTDRKLVNFQVFADFVHQAELERYQGNIKLDEKYPYNGAHGRLTYDKHDKHWIPHIGINNPSNCKADTKNKKYQEIRFFGWKIQPEKIQLTRDLTDNTMIYQGIRLPCKNDQGYCDPTTRTQATIVWFPEDTCTTFQVAKIHARMIKFHEKYFIESIPNEQVNPSRKQSTYFKNIHDIENKITHFQIYQETEFACKYRNPFYKTQYSEIFVEYEKGFDMTTGKKI